MRARRVVVGVVVAAVGVLGLLPASASAADDLTCPVLTSLTGPTVAVRPGGEAVVQVGATDDDAVGSAEVLLIKTGPGGGAQLPLSSTPGDPGTVRAVVPADAIDGDYVVQYVVLFDRVGNRSTYFPSSRTCRTVDAQTGPVPAPVDLRGLRVVVTGGLDRTPPVLSGLTAPDVVALGAPVTVGWRVTESAGSLSSLRLAWTKPTNTDAVVSLKDAPLEGSARLGLDAPGRSSLSSVTLTDRVGNAATYTRDGRVTYRVVGVTGSWTTSHSVDFVQHDIGVLPGAPAATVRGIPGGALVVAGDSWSRPVTLRVVLQPGNIVREVTTTASSSAQLRLTGLRNGTAYSWSVTATDAIGTGPASTGTVAPRMSTNVVVVKDFTNDRKVDVVALRPWSPGPTPSDLVRLYSTNGRAGFTGSRVLVEGQHTSQIGPSTPGIPAYPDTLGAFVRVWMDGELLEENANTPPVSLGTRGWSALRSIDGGYDLNGDGTGDIVAVDSSGHLRVYARTSKGALVRWPDIGTGWGPMLAVLSAGDLNGDRRNDIVAADPSGRLWLYPGNGKGGVTARRQIGSGWQSMGSIFAMRDFDGDGRADIGAVTADGRLLMYRGTGTGGLRAGVQVGSGWQIYF